MYMAISLIACSPPSTPARIKHPSKWSRSLHTPPSFRITHSRCTLSSPVPASLYHAHNLGSSRCISRSSSRTTSTHRCQCSAAESPQVTPLSSSSSSPSHGNTVPSKYLLSSSSNKPSPKLPKRLTFSSTRLTTRWDRTLSLAIMPSTVFSSSSISPTLDPAHTILIEF